VTSPQANPARREPLLWLQLLGLAAFPLEVAALLLLLAGADPGPLPGLERVFCWALGAVGPAVLFWRLPPDLWSLLLVQVPLRGRRPDQLRLSALQDRLPLKLLSAAGALPLLPLLWWADNRAGVAWAWSPLAGSSRLVVLLAGASMLTLLLWQWQQIIQALWMLSRPASAVAQTLPLSQEKAGDSRLSIGLPLLLLAPLEAGSSSEDAASSGQSPSEIATEAPTPSAAAAEAQVTGGEREGGAVHPDAVPPDVESPDVESPEAESREASDHEAEDRSAETGAVGNASTIKPEQAAEQSESTDLDGQV
jgi:hypothetical protein